MKAELHILRRTACEVGLHMDDSFNGMVEGGDTMVDARVAITSSRAIRAQHDPHHWYRLLQGVSKDSLVRRRLVARTLSSFWSLKGVPKGLREVRHRPITPPLTAVAVAFSLLHGEY